MAPLAKEFVVGVLLPWNVSRASKPSDPIGMSLASSSKSFNVNDNDESKSFLDHCNTEPVLVCPPSANDRSPGRVPSYDPHTPS